MTDFRTLLKDAQLLRRTVPVCLRGDLVAQIEEMERKLAIAEQQAPTAPSIEDESPTLGLARAIEALREQMTAHTYTFVVQALPSPDYRVLKAAHPPREDENGEVVAEDRLLDANYETFLEPLLRACCLDPVLDDGTWAELEPKLSDRQFAELVGMAIYVNKGSVDVPFSPAASRLLLANVSE